MSRKNRYKFRDRPTAATATTSSGESSSSVSTGASPALRPVSASAGAMSVHIAEYQIISKDLIRLVILNAVMLAAVLVVYFTNRSSGYLERIFHSLF